MQIKFGYSESQSRIMINSDGSGHTESRIIEMDRNGNVTSISEWRPLMRFWKSKAIRAPWWRRLLGLATPPGDEIKRS